MKIAIPTNDGLTISEHFGRSTGFLLFEVDSDRVVSTETKPNRGVHSHDHSACGGDHAGEGGKHDHGAILSSIAGSEVVICAGMGWRAAEALKLAGIREVVVTEPGNAQEKVQAYLRGELVNSGPGFCRCSH